MSSVSSPTVVSNTSVGGLTAQWSSLYNLVLTPQIWGEVIQQYGGLLELFEFLNFSGSTVDVAGETKTVFTKGSFERPLHLDAAIATAVAGAPITITIATTDYDSGGHTFVTAGKDKVMIPAEYCTISGVKCKTPQWYQFSAVGASGATSTAYPLDALTLLAVQVPATAVLMVSGGNYAAGSQGATPKRDGWSSDSFRTAIKKSAWGVEGSVPSSERYVDKLKGGGMGMFSDATIRADFELNSSINDELILGQEVTQTNAAIKQSNRYSEAAAVRGTKGLLNHLNDDGMKLYYASTFTTPDFDLVKALFNSQGMTDNKADFWMGSDLYRFVENSSLDFIKEYSGGTDLMRTYDEMGFGIKRILKNGITFDFHELSSFSNPVKLGLTAYNMAKTGFIVPSSYVAARTGMDVPEGRMKNLILGHKNYGGENRTRMMGFLNGMNGMVQIPGNNIADSYDSVEGHITSEFMLISLKNNQNILVQDSTVL